MTQGTTPRRCNLVLIRKRRQNWEDFEAIARHVRAIAPDVRPVLLTDRGRHRLRLDLCLRPTLVFSLAPLKSFKLWRGLVLQGQQMPKSQQYIALEKHGIPVPRWARLTENENADLSTFGKYVVTKPDWGGRGAEVKIKRRGRVRWKPPANVLAKHDTALLVQEFIYTGPWPVSYRVGTLFGQCIYAVKVQADQRRQPLSDPQKFTGDGMSIVSSGYGCTFELTADEEIIALAERSHAAFPEVPMLGVDLVRDQLTGKVYVLEVNPSGQAWPFSTPKGKRLQQTGNFDLERQFNAFRRSAEVLVDEARRRAA